MDISRFIRGQIQAACLLLSVLVAACVLPAGSAHAAELVFYLSADGDDRNDGLSTSKPLATLQRANDVVRDAIKTQPQDVRVHVSPGLYRNQRVRWNAAMPDHKVTIEGDPKQRPVFDGSGIDSLTGKGAAAHQVEWLYIARDAMTSEDQPTNVTVRGIEVRNYFSAIWIRGQQSGSKTNTQSIGRNIIDNMVFRNIGMSYSLLDENGGPAISGGAVLIRNSTDNVVRNCLFADISNDAAYPPDYRTKGMHAIYIMLFSDRTVIERNRFEHVYARGVIKTRQASNGTVVTGNYFADDTTLFIDQYCAVDEPACANQPKECPSWGATISGNRSAFYRDAKRARPTIMIDEHQQNDAYCDSAEFLKDNALASRNARAAPTRLRDADNRWGGASRSGPQH